MAGKENIRWGRVQLRGARRQPRTPRPPAPRTLSCWAGAGAELSGLVSPLGRANPATGYFCGAPGLESGAGPPPRAARETPVRRVRAPRAGAGPNPGPWNPNPPRLRPLRAAPAAARRGPAPAGTSPGPARPAAPRALPARSLTAAAGTRGSSGCGGPRGGCHRRREGSRAASRPHARSFVRPARPPGMPGSEGRVRRGRAGRRGRPH